MKFNLYTALGKKSQNNIVDKTKLKQIKDRLTDKNYLTFLEVTNGGSILNNSMNFYGIDPIILELDIFYNNFLFNKYYQGIIKDIFVFAEDIFGNVFGFQKDNSLVFINIETGCIENSFKNFDKFVIELSENLDFFSGYSIGEKWRFKNGLIEPFKRLSPIKPFVIGGEYSVENFHLLNKEDLLDYTSYIANQIKDLPDGTEIKIKIK